MKKSNYKNNKTTSLLYACAAWTLAFIVLILFL